MRVMMLLGLTAALAAGPVATAEAAPPFPDQIDLPNGWAPEGIAAGQGPTLYVGSLANGAVWQADARTGSGSVLVPGVSGNVAVGVDYDARTNRIWVAGGPTGAVRAYDASTGALLATYQFAAGFLNDLVVTNNAVYITDSMVQQLAVIPLGPGGTLPAPSDVETLPLSGDIAFVPGQFNVNGIDTAGAWLVVVQSNTGQLFRVDPMTGVADGIDLGGASLTAGDGLEIRGGTAYVVRNQLNQIAVLKLSRNVERAQLVDTLTSPQFRVPTTAAFAAGRLWAVNARFGTPPTPDTEYEIVQVP